MLFADLIELAGFNGVTVWLKTPPELDERTVPLLRPAVRPSPGTARLP
ncbi:MAG: hypothetical protein QOF58_5497 [Pseudonocardiales bacterium]|jgi:hypothetical protein|nr:hypothetical protein [Pseudonocardiales bacterium]